MLDVVIARLAEVIKAEQVLQARIAEGLGVLEAVEALMRSDRVRYLD
jgi:4-hydroxy-4-methyl-2-oxoglutarate aldolase